MSNKIHIGKNGPSKCVAKTPATCKVNGGNSDGNDHYDSWEDAQQAYETQLSEEYGTFNTSSTSTTKINHVLTDETPLDYHTLEETLGDYEINDVDEIEENEDGSFTVHYNVGNASKHFQTKGNTKQFAENLLDSLEEEDIDEDFIESGTAEYLRARDETNAQLNYLANEVRRDLEMNQLEHKSIKDRIREEKHDGPPVSSEVSNDDTVTSDNVSELIEDYELDYNNSEVYEEDGEFFITVEAPNHLTHNVHHNPEESGNTVKDFRKSLVRSLREVDADDTFDELWSNDFGKHNGFTPSEFYVKLKADEAYFKKRAREIKKNIG